MPGKAVNRSATGKAAYFRKEISRYPHDKARSHFFQLLNQRYGRKSPAKKPYRLSPLHALRVQKLHGYKRDAQELFDNLGLSLSAAVNLFLRQAVREQAIPFRVRIPMPLRTTRKP